MEVNKEKQTIIALISSSHKRLNETIDTLDECGDDEDEIIEVLPSVKTDLKEVAKVLNSLLNGGYKID
ncbi:hypothetical protein CIG2463D_1503 [Campylobacter iguaniorum]|uniref:hypothetical protein n=1 Tax=Campylobacter iguaniorum TaxID=1244531 RepID=UPI00073A2306|nr:hypothetical protein [Campylobacter iguaniorum]ALV25068.1 hypothetical protein CIG2463D_1503 [Campylobacter iguaniorum]